MRGDDDGREASRGRSMRVAKQALLEETEVRLLLTGLRDCYGFDFRDYEPSWLSGRLWECARATGSETLSGFQERVLHEPRVLESLLRALAVPRKAFFGDQQFYHLFRSVIVPILRTYPSVQIWHPACSNGVDAYSLAIVIEEEGLGERVRIYATDVSESLYARAREGVFPQAAVTAGTEAYLKSGGKGQLKKYYSTRGRLAVLDPRVRSRISFGEHHLATDNVFNEFQVIVARDILSMFNLWLQGRVHALILNSLSRFGMVCLGPQDSFTKPDIEAAYEELLPGAKLYRKASARA